MKLIADMHTHIYSCHDTGRAFSALGQNLQRLMPDAAFRLAFLTERAECHVFDGLKSGRITPPLGYETGKTDDDAALWILREGKRDLLLLAGRQVATRERLEVLCLAAACSIPDGLPIAEVIRQIHQAGGLPVLAWSPGKWLFRRGCIVKQMLDLHHAGDLVLGDTTLRPSLWPTPGLMKYGRELGHRTIAGTDALPLAGEERLLGTYGTLLDMPFDPEHPARSFVKSFHDGDVNTRMVGHRSSVKEVELSSA
jgi:hypothetical protein